MPKPTQYVFTLACEHFMATKLNEQTQKNEITSLPEHNLATERLLDLEDLLSISI